MCTTLMRLPARRNHCGGALAGLATSDENSYKTRIQNNRTRLRIVILFLIPGPGFIPHRSPTDWH